MADLVQHGRLELFKLDFHHIITVTVNEEAVHDYYATHKIFCAVDDGGGISDDIFSAPLSKFFFDTTAIVVKDDDGAAKFFRKVVGVFSVEINDPAELDIKIDCVNFKTVGRFELCVLPYAEQLGNGRYRLFI